MVHTSRKRIYRFRPQTENDIYELGTLQLYVLLGVCLQSFGPCRVRDGTMGHSTRRKGGPANGEVCGRHGHWSLWDPSCSCGFHQSRFHHNHVQKGNILAHHAMHVMAKSDPATRPTQDLIEDYKAYQMVGSIH